jgi:hypothetical protein
MNHKKIAEYAAAVFATMFALLATIPAYAPWPPASSVSTFPMPFARAYAAQINATGTLTLKNSTDGNPFDLKINITFTSLVPSTIVPDEYDAEFHGFATAPGDHVRLDGLMIANGINFWVAFTVDRPSGLSGGRYSANGPLHLNISAFTLPPQKITMVEMKGNVAKFDDKDAFGFLEANVKTGSHNFTNVHTSFTLQPPPRNGEGDENGAKNFTRSFYIVNLVNATKTEMDYDGSALFIDGYWNVYNKTITVTHFDHEQETTVINVQTLLANRSGTFNVTLTPQISPVSEKGRWKTRGNFTLDIPDLKDTISGNVIFYHAKFADQSGRGIPRCDFNQDHAVNMADIGQVAKAFRAKYGDSKYDPELDIDGNLIIDMTEIASTAVEFGQEY